MKRKLLSIIGICVMLTGCGVHTYRTSQSVTVNKGPSRRNQVPATETVETTENMAVTEDTEEADPEGTIRTTAEDLKKLPPEIQSIYDGNGTFYDTEEKKEFTKESFRVTDPDSGLSTAVLWNEFFVSDIDGDGEYELGVYLEREDDNVSIYNEVRIFDLSQGTVYAHPYPFRGVASVYENGVFVGSSGAVDNVLYRISFDGEKETETVEARSETKGAKVHYSIGSEEVTEEEYYDYISRKYGINEEHTEIARILWSNEYIREIAE